MRKAYRALLVAMGVVLAGCSAASRFGAYSPSTPSSTTPTSRQPAPVLSRGKVLLSVEGIASYYADEFDAKKTASGEIFDKNALTAAHREFPFGTVVLVTNLSNGKSVQVTVNDRGPFDKSRIIDLSEGAARAIDMIQDGTARVRLDVLKWGAK